MWNGGCSWVDADKHSFSLLPASVLVGEQIISTYCWVLREHASVSSKEVTTTLECGSYRGVALISVSVFFGWCSREFWGCVLFENCTVDASIFVVSNEERTVDALAPGADEGRRRLR